jgi:hypothetical protein
MKTAAQPSVVDQPARAAKVIYLDELRRRQTGPLRLVS